MLDARLALSLGLCLCLTLPLAAGCGPEPDDDDSAPEPDDDDDDLTPSDDDDATPEDPCEGIDDRSSFVNSGSEITGSTSGETDDFWGSCSNAPIPEYVFSITAPVTATYSVTTASSSTDFDTLIFAFTDCEDPEGSELDCNDDIAEGNLDSVLSFEVEEGSTFYVAVEGYDDTGSFGVIVDAVVCGDGLVSGDELCDDGNADDGDGCDSSCSWECDGEDDREPDNDAGSATALDTLPAEFSDGYLCSSDLADGGELYLDAFELTIADEDAYVHVLSGPGSSLVTDCAEQDLGLYLADADFDDIAAAFSEDDACAELVVEPGAGTWYLLVAGDDPTLAPQDYSLAISSGVSVCGDSTVEGLEQCDDGNADSGDGCTADCYVEETCTLEPGDLVDSLDGDTVLGSTAGGSDNLVLPCAAGGSPEVAYLFTAAVDGPVAFSTDHPGTDYDTALFVRSACADPSPEALLGCNDDAPDGELNDGLNSLVIIEAEAGASYAVIVDGYNGAEGSFELSITTPVCELEPGDLVDQLDGDPVLGDTSGAEDANPVPCIDDQGSPELAYLFTAAADGPVVFSTDNEGTDYDTALYLRSACYDSSSAALLACNDDGGLGELNNGYNSWIGIEAEAGASYTLFVDGFGGDAGAFELSIYTPECGNDIVEPTEACDDGNTQDGDGCESDCESTP